MNSVETNKEARVTIGGCKRIKKSYLKGFTSKLRRFKEAEAIGHALEAEKRCQMNFNKLMVIHEDYGSWLESLKTVLESHDKRIKASYDSIMVDIREKIPLPAWTTGASDNSSLRTGVYRGTSEATKESRTLIKFYEDKMNKLMKINQEYFDLHKGFKASLMKDIEHASSDWGRFDVTINNVMNEN